MGRHTTVGFCLALLLFSLRGILPADAQATALEPSARDQDSRLSARLTLKATGVPLGQVIELIRKKTGVDLSLNDDLPSSGTDVTIWVQDAALYDVMNALWSLLSYNRAPWEWRRDGDAVPYRYQLVETAAARLYAEKLRNSAEQAFQDQAKTLFAFAHMTPQERQDHIKDFSAGLFQEDSVWAQKLLNSPSAEANLWPGLRLFDETLSPDLKNRVLHDHQTVRIPVGDLSAEGRSFISGLAKGNTLSENGGPEREVVPRWVEFRVEPAHGTRQSRPSALYIAPEHVGGQGYVGSGWIERGLKKRLRAAWLLPGDAEDNTIESRIIPAPAKQEVEESLTYSTLAELRAAVAAGKTGPTAEAKQARAELRWKQAADAAPFLFIARLPSHNLMDAGKPYGQTVGAFLQKYEGSYPILMHKWRKSVLLVSNTDWYFDEETSVPYAKTLKLRALCKKGRGFMSLADIADTVLSMSTLQVERAGAEFPVLASGEIFRPVFLLARTHTGFYSTQGAVLDAELSSELAKFPIVANCPLFKDNRAIAIRFVERTAPSEQLQGWEARIEVLDRGKVWRPVAGFPQKQHISAD